MSTSPNPYAPNAPIDSFNSSNLGDGLESLGKKPPKGPLAIWFRWSAVCAIAAAPSFYVGYGVSDGQVAAMLLGIVLFIVLYTVVDLNTSSWPIRQKTMVRRILVFTYGTRIFISIVFPLGLAIDMLVGLFATSCVEAVTHLSMGSFREDGFQSEFALALLLTIVQGFFLNILLAVWALLTLGIARLSSRLWNRIHGLIGRRGHRVDEGTTPTVI
jgi:hypothetical protein